MILINPDDLEEFKVNRTVRVYIRFIFITTSVTCGLCLGAVIALLII